MFKLFRESFKTTNDCIIVATPLIIFLSIFGWYLSYAAGSVDNVPKFILAVITAIVLLCGCLSGWLYMVKKTISMSKKIIVFDKDRGKAFLSLLLSLPKGVGRLFLPILGIILVYFCIYSFLLYGAGAVITKYVGTIDLDLLNTASFFVSSQELLDEFNALSNRELLIINLWNFAIIFITAIISFLTLLWIPEVVYGEKNPYKALFISIRNIFKTFRSSLIIFVYISFLIIFISILNTLLMFNPFLYFFVLILYYYFLIYIVVLLFTYYEHDIAN